MKIYTIIGGANGVGKSSFLGILDTERSDLGRIIDADKLNLLHGGNVIKGGKQAVREIAECLKDGVSFTQETTLSGHKTLSTIKKALENGYAVRLFYIGISTAEESLSRIENRVKKGGHDIPAPDVIRRYESRFDDLKKILPFCFEASFFDNENGFVKVAELREKNITPVGEYVPEWLKKLIEVVKN